MDLSEILCPPLHPLKQKPLEDDADDILTPAKRDQFFKMAHGRKVSSVAKHYPLPVDEDEIKRMSTEHRMLRFVYGGKNYVGPVNDVLAPTRRRQRRILDCGTGSGLWACEMADEFPHAQVIGVDVAPIQPDEVPVNCSFELYDITKGRRLLPYDSGYFDLVHMRSIHTGVSDYAALLREAFRVLRPGGMIILAEIDTTPLSEAKLPIPSGPEGGAPGWCAFWDEYRRCAIRRGIDVTIPTRLRAILQHVGGFENINAQEALLPIGFWNRDPVLLTIGQLAWMNYDTLLMSLRPLLLEHSALPPHRVDQIVAEAQADLYYPEVRPNVCLHIIHAIKL
ncbi:S-adenosyl-L-methionine-dependent methyltransferase [Ramaria rubella]|nr:S-adenosyl-L-methionine-dependent methyltransferase [Ramaria rubella]